MAQEELSPVSPVTYERLAALEDDFEEVDNQIKTDIATLQLVRQQYQLSKPVYAKRAEVIAKISNFWALVLEQAPPEIDSFITPDDSRVLAELKSISVSRPEIETSTTGHPRSLSIRFEFNANDRFDDNVLEKHFHYRRSSDGWAGLVSEPVKIHWKKDQDLTDGLTDMAHALFEARKEAGDFRRKDLPEYDALKKKAESWNAMNTSFFTWFGFVSGSRWVSVEESEAATTEHQRKRQARKPSEETKDPNDGNEDEEIYADDDLMVEVCENGEDLAVSIAEDLWPGAIRYFTDAQELGDISDVELDEFDSDDLEDGDDMPADIRALIEEKGEKRRQDENGSGPNKRAKN